MHLAFASGGILSIHGSGTSNPARCYGSVMEELTARSKLPLRLTYRSVGSSIGLEEFKNNFDPLMSASNFGSGEIPLASEDWQRFREENVTVLQLPTLYGAVSFFHSVPETPNLNLTSCLLARIFMRDIKDWAHPDIREINPGLTKLFERDETDSLGASMRIRVARREEGSSNTNAITQVSLRIKLLTCDFKFLLLTFAISAVSPQSMPAALSSRNGGPTARLAH